MRRMLIALTAAASLMALGASVYAQEMTLKGQIIDETCYLDDKVANKWKDHKTPAGAKVDCATACAKMGQPLALLTADGKTYTIMGEWSYDNNARLLPHINHMVELTGGVNDGMGRLSIVVKTLKMTAQ